MLKLFKEKKYVSPEVKEQRKFKAKLKERVIWVSSKVVDIPKRDSRNKKVLDDNGKPVLIKVKKLVQGTYIRAKHGKIGTFN